MPGWADYPYLLETEFIQSREEGRDPARLDALQREAAALPAGDAAAAQALYDRICAVPILESFPFREPNGLEEIRALRKAGDIRLRPVAMADLPDRMHGAWLGRCVGCALGKPVEWFMGAHKDLASWERQKRYLTAISQDEWPLRDYIPAHSPAEEETGVVGCPDSTREKITFMETDDDIRYTVIGQKILAKKGREFTTRDVARAWVEELTYRQVCTAETQAYRNLTARGHFHSGDHFQEELDWEWVATNLNPYREWIGAQIRVDSYGYAAPGDPALAAEFAWRDARLSHVKNGIYGAMFCAAMIAAAFVTDDVRTVVEAGLAEIPATSRLYSEMREVMAICGGEEDFETVLKRIYALLGHYSPVHTNNNAGLCVAALLTSRGDFAQAITRAVMGGWDTDCNGATVGSVVGAMCGGKRAPKFWTGRLNDTLKSGLAGYHPIAISECARRSVEVAEKVLARM